jgi:GTPase
MNLPVVAIVGRANVGKSTLYNRLIGQRSAIVNDFAGVTRDRLYGEAEWQGKAFTLIDTGGFDFEGVDDIELQMVQQARIAEEEADVVLVIVDLMAGLVEADREVIKRLRKTGKAMLLVPNKSDCARGMDNLGQFSEMGIETLFPISAEHGIGVAELLDEVTARLPEMEEVEEDPNLIKIAVVGKPNAGKSSLVNQLLGSSRCIVSEIPGATRDAIDTQMEFEGRPFMLVDTAGIRRKGRTQSALQKFSVIMALKALDRCDIALLIVDGDTGVTDQDARIAGYAAEKGRGCIIVLNKWDTLKKSGEAFDDYVKQIKGNLKFLDYAPVVALSALTGEGVHKLLPKVLEVHEQYARNIPTSQLNNCFEAAIAKNPMSSYRGKFIKMFYVTQVRSSPPLIRCFVNFPAGIHFSYKRYLTNSLRKQFGLVGTPVRLIFSGKQEEG